MTHAVAATDSKESGSHAPPGAAPGDASPAAAEPAADATQVATHGPAVFAPESRFEELLPPEPVECRLRIATATPSTAALLAGLAMLRREGRIRLQLEWLPVESQASGSWHSRTRLRPQPVIEVDGASAVVDTHDDDDVDAEDLGRHDLYFKRCLAPESLLLPDATRLRALPPLHDVRTDFLHLAELRGELGGAQAFGGRLAIAARWLAGAGAARLGLGPRPNWSRLHAPPVPGQPQRVLLVANLRDPASIPPDDTGARAEYEAMNALRIDCIRALRRAFGSRFHGGLQPGAYAQRIAPDLVLGAGRPLPRQAFLRLLRGHGVCVTPTGPLGTCGPRLADAIALSRAIVSEPLRNAIAGDLGPGTHYLEYATPEDCVSRVAWLFDRAAQRDAMARANWEYYQRWQRPDRLALRLVALTWAAARARAGVTA